MFEAAVGRRFGSGNRIPWAVDGGRALNGVAPARFPGKADADAALEERDGNGTRSVPVDYGGETVASGASGETIGHACNGHDPIRTESKAAAVLHSIFSSSLAIVELFPKHGTVHRCVLGDEIIVVESVGGKAGNHDVSSFVYRDCCGDAGGVRPRIIPAFPEDRAVAGGILRSVNTGTILVVRKSCDDAIAPRVQRQRPGVRDARTARAAFFPEQRAIGRCVFGRIVTL